ncbi:MAG: GAF domain-containing protein [Candidatus Omnitrophica bacterium]|nr:GAF domain-containing protein [Candidatus Omnitrophota bacterium]
MGNISKLLLVLGLSVLAGLFFTNSAYAKMIYTVLLFIIIVALAVIAIKEQGRRQNITHALKEAEKAYEKLDEQAKMILQTDLKLNMAQEELDKRIEGLYGLHELGKIIGKVFNLKELLELVDEELVFSLGFDKSIVLLLDPEQTKIRFSSAAGYTSEEIRHIKETLSSAQAIEMLKNEQQVQALSQDKPFLNGLLKLRSAVIVPLSIKERCSGLILMGSEKKGVIQKEDNELIQILAQQLSASIENIYLYEELWNSQRELELKVQERTKELQQAYEDLKKLDEKKKEFVSAVSHELRTPLTSIKGYASILTSGKLGDVTEEQKERLQKINIHSNKLVSLVNNLLDISRIESGKVEMNIKPVLVKTLLDEIADMIAPQVKEKMIELKVEIPSSIEEVGADKEQLSRVFINLLSNAVKFTPDKGHIKITASKKEGYLQFDIADSGIGISRQDQEKLFTEFFRTQDAIDKGIKGTGLGLSLVKRIVEAHKGTIWVTSEVGKGAVFHFTLPAY